MSSERKHLKPAVGTAQIENCLLFAGLTEAQRVQVHAHCRSAELEEGSALFKQGQATQDFFLLESGRIKLALMARSGDEKIVELVSPGDTFAEALMFTQQPHYPVTATALECSRVLCFNMQHYLNILHQSTDACFAVMGAMSVRLRRMIGEIDQLTLHSAKSRLIYYLLDKLPEQPNKRSTSVLLSTPKHVVAARLSMTPETLSRCFSRLTADSLISVNDDTITLHDVTHLKRLLSEGAL